MSTEYSDSEVVFAITVGDVRAMVARDDLTLSDHDIDRLKGALPDNNVMEAVENVVFFAATNDEFGWEED